VTVRRRLSLIAAAYIVVTLLGGLFTIWRAQQWTSALNERRDWMVAAEHAARLRAAYGDQETGERGYLITGQQDFLQPYTNGIDDARVVTTQLTTFAANHEPAMAALDDVSAAAEAWRTDAAEPEIAARKAGDTSRADALVAGGTGKARFDDLRSTLDTLDGVIDRGVAKVDREVTEARQRTYSAFFVSVAAAALVTVVAAWLVRRWVNQPLKRLAAAAGQVRRGERVSIDRTGPSDVAAVARAVDEMQRTIIAQRDQAVRAREAIEQSAVLAVQVRSELEGDLGDFPGGWTIAAGLRPAEGVVAGDCYEVGLISPTTIAVTVLDIAGHGAEAAIAALKCKELLKAGLRAGLAPGRALEWLAAQEQGLDPLFLTAFVAVFDAPSGYGTYANAGHPPALVCSDGRVSSLPPTGPILGPIPGGWRTGELQLDEGDKLVVFTDGLVEARDETRAFYGDDRLSELVSSLECRDAQPVVDAILDDLDQFQPERLADDVTLIVVCRGGLSGAEREPDDTMSEEAAAFGDGNEGVTEGRSIDERRSTMSGT
jgi:serine phosphatase RsbU (regulator of sigma subunit)